MKLRQIEDDRTALNWWFSLSDNQRYTYSIAYVASERVHEIYPRSFNSNFVYFIYNKVTKREI